jgi:hypothetical protein
MFLVVSGNSRSDARFLTDKLAKSPPRPRIACLASPTFGTRYLDPDKLSPHAYKFALWESLGIVYTCRGGHVDLTHLRKAADWAAYLAYHGRKALLEGKTHLTFKMHEPSRYYVRIQYPADWTRLPQAQKEAIALDASIELGQYLSYVGNTWHEILTWYGYKGSGFFPEYHSSFSWEDNYSHAIGCYIGSLALRDKERDYVQAMTYYIDRELERLQVQPKATAKAAGERVRGSWFTGGYFRLTMVKRHLDIGFDSGVVVPWLVPGMGECPDATPRPYPAPSLASLEKRGFQVRVQIEPREWEKGKILRVVYPNGHKQDARIEPAKHFGPIIEDIRATAIERYGPHADECGDSANTSRPLQARHDKTREDDSAAPERNGAKEPDVRVSDLAARATRWLAEGSPRP